MAREILAAPELLRLTRLCGISLITLYGLVSAIGDIHRFAHPRKLAAYFGVNPSVSQSGNYEGPTALKRHGRGAMRALLVQSAKKLLQVDHPLQKWGLAVAARRGRNKAAVAVARKLCVAVWHVLQGHVIGALERPRHPPHQAAQVCDRTGSARNQSARLRNQGSLRAEETLSP